jgi:hypothetical protein
MTSVTKQQKAERTRLQLPPCADLLSIEQETGITKPLEQRSGRRPAMTKTKGEPRRRLKKRPRRQPEKAAAAAGGSVATATGDGATTAARGSTAADRGGRD